MSFGKFCLTFQIKLAAPASPAQLSAAEDFLGAPFPSSVRKIYEVADGGRAKGALSSLELQSIKRGLRYARVLPDPAKLLGLWPLLDNNDSNPICVSCKPPLAGYVIQIRHGDTPRLLCRSLAEFFKTAIDFVSSHDYLETSELPSRFAVAGRTQRDRGIAKRLIGLTESPNGPQGESLHDILCFACDLLDDQDVELIRGLLDRGDDQVQAYVTDRLGRIPGARATRTAQSVKETFDTFVDRCGDMLLRAGLAATVVEMYGKKTIRLDPGPVWLNMTHIYAERKRPDWSDWFIQLAVAAAAPRKTRAKRK